MIDDTQKSKAYCVLIADDDPVFQENIATSLRDNAFESVAALDGAEAMTLLQDHWFDLAIIDLLMQKIDGLRLIARIRATPVLRTLPILIITSQCDPQTKADGLQVGANDFLTKTLDWSLLPGQITALIEQR